MNTLLLTIALAIPPVHPAYDSAWLDLSGGGTITGPLHLPDDIAVSWGNTLAAPDCWIEWDTAGTDGIRLICTDVDAGGGTDGTVWSVSTGTDDFVVTGNVTATNITAAAAGTISWTGRQALTSPADEKVKFCNAAGNKCFIIETQTDGYFRCRDSAGTGWCTADLGTTTIQTGGLYLEDDVWFRQGDNLDFSQYYSNAGTMYVFRSSDVDGADTDGNIFTIQSGGTDIDFNTGAKGATVGFNSVTANCTFSGGGGSLTCTTSQFIPYGASVVHVTGRQVTPSSADCTTCKAGADMGPGLDDDQYGAALECDVNDTLYTKTTYTANVMGTCLLAGGCEITMTAIGGTPVCTDAVAAWTVSYFDGTAATSD
jgi:hypothetical protein